MSEGADDGDAFGDLRRGTAMFSYVHFKVIEIQFSKALKFSGGSVQLIHLYTFTLYIVFYPRALVSSPIFSQVSLEGPGVAAMMTMV